MMRTVSNYAEFLTGASYLLFFMFIVQCPYVNISYTCFSMKIRHTSIKYKLNLSRIVVTYNKETKIDKLDKKSQNLSRLC